MERHLDLMPKSWWVLGRSFGLAVPCIGCCCGTLGARMVNGLDWFGSRSYEYSRPFMPRAKARVIARVRLGRQGSTLGLGLKLGL